MDLFEIDENSYLVRLNREWLYLIPEFSTILKKDKGSTGDKGGHRKLWARTRFAFIYFMVDFKSPLYSWEDGEKLDEALRYTSLTKSDIDKDYMSAALEMYDKLQHKASRSLRTLNAVNKGLVQLDSYFENIDFDEVDKMGRIKYTASDYVKNISMLNKAYDELKKFKDRVMAELTKTGGIRGAATKGDREINTATTTANIDNLWEEGGNPIASSPNWLDMNTGTQFKDDIS